MAIRLALISGHYRADRDWTDSLLAEAQARLRTWRSAFSLPGGPDGFAVVEEIRSALVSDLDSPRALAAVDRWCQQALEERGEENGNPGLVARAVDALLGVAL